jgi:ubiquinone/menaquinone biosynthesis C-methylase UbiE
MWGRFSGCDFSDTAIANTQRLLQNIAYCEAVVADIQDIPFSDNTFDVVVSLEP